MAHNKKITTQLFKLYRKQGWLMEKEEAIESLLSICEDQETKSLILELLNNFIYPNIDQYKEYITQICNYITEDSGFNEEQCQVVATVNDEGADSSQLLLQNIKTELAKRNWENLELVNSTKKIAKLFKKGKTQVILLDEFIGTGTTFINRIDTIRNDQDTDNSLELKCCVIAGMKFGLTYIKEQTGLEVKCLLELNKGISEYYTGANVAIQLERMKVLEKELYQDVKRDRHCFQDYSLGYLKVKNNGETITNTIGSEALYSGEGYLSNTPNSVFPIFWWAKDKNGEDRNTLLNRKEKKIYKT